MQADDEPQYPYPVYDSPSSEFESVLSSKEWVLMTSVFDLVMV